MGNLEGVILPLPGWCYNRLTDFTCHIWVEPNDVAQHHQMRDDHQAGNSNVQSNLDSTYTIPDEIPTAVENGAYPYMYYGIPDLTYGAYDTGFGNDTNATDYGYDDVWDFDSGNFGTNLPEKVAANQIVQYVSPLLLLIGTFGNIFCVIIMQKLSKKVMSTCLYLGVLAIVDLTVLYMRCGNDWLAIVASVDLSNHLMVYSESICKVYPFSFSFIFHFSKWLIVAMTIEAFISTRYPSRTQKMCTLERGRAIILLLTVMLICVNIHFFWSYELVPLKDLSLPPGLFCTFAKDSQRHSEEFQEMIWPILDLLVSEVLPTATVVTCCIIMISQIIQGKHLGDKYHQRWQKKFMLDSQAIEQIKVTFLVVCICYVLLTLPKFGYLIFRYLVEKHRLVEFSLQVEAQQLLAHAVCSTFEYMFWSCKFFIYFITSKRFRKEFCLLFQCCKKHQVVHMPSLANMQTRPLMQNGSTTERPQPRVELCDREPSVITTV